MARRPEELNNGYRDPGINNKALKLMMKKGLPLSRGDVFVNTRFMMRNPNSGKKPRRPY